jgi:hypothetical protein
MRSSERGQSPINSGSPSESISTSGKEIVNTYTLNLSKTDAATVNGRAAEFKLLASVRYTDIFNEWHETTMCAKYFPPEGAYKFCESGNQVR